MELPKSHALWLDMLLQKCQPEVVMHCLNSLCLCSLAEDTLRPISI